MDRLLRTLGLSALICAGTPFCATAATSPLDLANQCVALEQHMPGRWPDSSTHLNSVQWIAQGSAISADRGAAIQAPAHCEITGILQERVGEGGQHYAIRFHLRLPAQWNGRFLLQGGGGSNGNIGDALGSFGAAAAPALLQGYAVASQDSGHDNTINNDPARGGVLVFGLDEQARANYGHASLPLVARAAKAAIIVFYGKAQRYSYFAGCSKGGEEGMALAQRYPGEFDGVIANAPGMSLPRAALAEAWDTQVMSKIVAQTSSRDVTVQRIADAFSDADLKLIGNAVLAACDADDGLVDGIVGNFPQCTFGKVRPQLQQRQCLANKTDQCLSRAQLQGLEQLMQGPHDSNGRVLYSDWPWDAGIASRGWRLWKMGLAEGHPPSLGITLGGPSLAMNFTTPPTPVSADPQEMLRFMLGFDFDRDAPKIQATNVQFPRSAWDDMAARSNDLSGFRQRGGKLIVVHGMSDPVFSVNDTLAWWREVDQKNSGGAARFARVFPVPGMNHCGGGDATDQFDALGALVDWVEEQRPPERLEARANPQTPWPTRTRPLCPYPRIARYNGSGDPDKTESFTCRT